MMAVLPGDVQRILTPDELPASVRDIPADHNPLAEGVLMKHQRDWLKLCAEHDLTAAEKGRRTGITYATALNETITAATRKTDGGDNVYYIGDTKDKGLEFIGYCAHLAKVMGKGLAEGWQGIEVVLFEDVQKDGSTKHITAYRIRFASGFQILALSSNPANIRGLQGIVIIDEAAFHKNVQAVIDAATALIIWGGKIRIISTHNGQKNPFNQLVLDARAGKNAFKVFHVTFDDAVENGLYERVCLMKGRMATADGKAEWYRKIRGAYGSNAAAMREELDAIPREGSGVAIPGILIEQAMREVRPVLRLALNSDFAGKPKSYREAWCEDWIHAHLKPLLNGLDVQRQHSLGMDFARHRDFSILAPMSVELSLTRKVPFMVELHNVPSRQQAQILYAIIGGLPRFHLAALDATGSGSVFAEYAAEDFGKHAIMEVMLSQAWYRENMPLFVQAFEDQAIDLPRDADVRNDLRALERVDGIVKVPDLRMKDVKDADLMRHGDAAIALALAYVATLAHKAPVEFFAMKDGAAPDGFAWQRRAASDFSLTPEAIDWSLYD